MVIIIAVCGWIVTIIIAVWGWKATHALNIKAQNEAFIKQIVNDARIQTTSAIRDYQDWLGEVEIAISGLSRDVILHERGFSRDWAGMSVKLGDLFFSVRRNLEWAFRLEEHEILFPKTAECRRALVKRQRQITEYLRSFATEFLVEDFKGRKKAIEKAEKDVKVLRDQAALTEDLRIYLQNLCLSSLTGNKVPERKPTKPSLPRLVEDEKGNLQIVARQDTSKTEDSQVQSPS